MKNINFKIYTLGCKVNQYDSLALSGLLMQQGYKEQKYKEKDLNLIIVNSCAVTHSAISKSRKVLKAFKKENPRARLVLMGCWPQTHNLKENLADLILGVGNLEKVVLEINKLFNIKNQVISKVDLVNANKTRYFIKVQDGCNQFCSYCIIPYSRGRLKSRKELEIIAEAQKAISLGYKEIVLTGIHLGLYGKDLKTKNLNLLKLLKELNNIKGRFRIRLSSIEVNEISDDIIAFIAKKDSKICPHLHISLQSGSNKILKLMNRPYTKEEFKKVVNKLRIKMPDIAISTDIIVGFPSETEKDFLETMSFSKKIGFSKIHVFSFSAHKKTSAYNFPKQVNGKTIKNRSKRLRDLNRELKNNYYQKMKDKKLEIVVERVDNNYAYGYSQYYFICKINIKKINSQVQGKRLLGKLISSF